MVAAAAAAAAAASGTPQSLKLTYPETLDRIKEEFQFLQTQYHRWVFGSFNFCVFVIPLKFTYCTCYWKFKPNTALWLKINVQAVQFEVGMLLQVQVRWWDTIQGARLASRFKSLKAYHNAAVVRCNFTAPKSYHCNNRFMDDWAAPCSRCKVICQECALMCVLDWSVQRVARCICNELWQKFKPPSSLHMHTQSLKSCKAMWWFDQLSWHSFQDQ